MKRFSGLMVLTAVLSLGLMSSLVFAGEPTPAEQKDKKDAMGPKLSLSDDKKEEKKDKGGHVVSADDKKEEKKDMGGK